MWSSALLSESQKCLLLGPLWHDRYQAAGLSDWDDYQYMEGMHASGRLHGQQAAVNVHVDCTIKLIIVPIAHHHQHVGRDHYREA